MEKFNAVESNVFCTASDLRHSARFYSGVAFAMLRVMLQLFYSNRYETLVAALLADMADAPSEPWIAQPLIVPSAALRRRLELDIAAQRGVCANVDFRYLAQWLWEQIGGVIPVQAHSPYAPDRLVWRCY